MPLPYSIDLRERVVRLVERGMTQTQVAKMLDLSRSTVSGYVRQAKAVGHLNPLPHSGGAIHKKLSEPHFDALKRYLKDKPGATNPELVQLLVDEFGPQVRVDPSQISRVLKAQGITRKKKSSTTPR